MKIKNNKSPGRTMIIGPVAWGGVWGHGPELARHLSAGRTVEYYDPPRPPEPGAPSFSGGDSYPAPPGLHVVRRKSSFNPGLWYGLEMEWKNFRAALRSRAESLVTYYPLGSSLALLWFRLSGRRTMFVYADSPDILRHPLARLLVRGIGLRLSTTLAHVSLATSGPLYEDLARFTTRRAFVPNGVRLENIPAELMQDRRGQDTQFTVGFVGFFGDWVDLETVAAAARALPEVRFVIVGEGPARDRLGGKEKEPDNMFFTGRLPHGRVFGEIAKMDLCLAPFIVNQVTDRVSPVKLFEYWALGKPVLASACRELRRLAEKHPGAIEIFTSPVELARCINIFRNDPERYARSGSLAREAVKTYDWNVLGRRIESLLVDGILPEE